MSRFLRWVYIVNWTFVLIALIELSIASQQSMPLGIVHLNYCGFPCWIGILPGKSTVAEAKRRIREVYRGSAKYTVVENAWGDDIRDTATNVSQLRVVFFVPKLTITETDVLEGLELRSHISMGEIITALPSPSAVVPWGTGGGTFLALLYKAQSIVLTVDTPIDDPTKCQTITGHEPLQTITIFATLPANGYWAGYIPQQWKSFGHCHRWHFVSDT